MFKRMALIIFVVTLGLMPVRAQEKPALVVHAFTLASDVKWPYGMKQLQTEAIAALMGKDGTQFDVVPDAPPNQSRIYLLDGEVMEWHAGNRAERLVLGGGATGKGRETAKIHYWLTDKEGKRLFEHTDTIRQAFLGNIHSKSVGQLAQPFGDKIAERLKEAKLVP